MYYSRERKSLTEDFHPAQNHVGIPAEPLWWGVEEHNTSQYALFLTHQTVNVEFHDYFLDVLIKCTRKMFLFSPHTWKPKQGCHHGFARDENRLSTTYALDCIFQK